MSKYEFRVRQADNSHLVVDARFPDIMALIAGNLKTAPQVEATFDLENHEDRVAAERFLFFSLAVWQRWNELVQGHREPQDELDAYLLDLREHGVSYANAEVDAPLLADDVIDGMKRGKLTEITYDIE